jgi:hypothetical protein
MLLYILMLADALWAGRLDWMVKSEIKFMTSGVHQAMKLSALAVMENGEAEELGLQADQKRGEAAAWQNRADRASYFSKADRNNANKDRLRGALFERATVNEQEAVDKMEAKAEQEHLKLTALLANVTLDLEQGEKDADKLAKLHSGSFCGPQLMHSVCDVLGGAAELQHQANQEALKIHRDWLAAQKAGRVEAMEEYVVDILQGKTSEYNRTATGLLRAAAEWDKSAAYDLKRAEEYNATALDFAAAAGRLEQQQQNENEWQSKNRSAAQHILSELEHEHEEISRNAALAVVVALPAIVFFSFRMMVGLGSLLTTLSPGSSPTDDRDFYRAVVNCIQHVMIFLFVVGIVGNEFQTIHLYDIRQSGAVISRFILLASFLQALFLQALPHIESEWPLERTDTSPIIKNFGRRLVAISALFAIEVLLAWLSMRNWLFTPDVIAFCGSTLFRAASLVAMFMESGCFGPREALDSSDGQSTVLTEDDSSTAFFSEATPLTMANISIQTGESPTDALMQIDLSPEGRRNYAALEMQFMYTSSSASSPYSISMKEELLRLEVPFDALILACAAIVFRNALAIASLDATFMGTFLVIRSVLLVAFVVWAIYLNKNGASWPWQSPLPVSMISTTDAMKKVPYPHGASI